MARNYLEVRNLPATLLRVEKFITGKTPLRNGGLRVNGDEYFGIIEKFRAAGVDLGGLSKNASLFLKGSLAPSLIYKHQGRGRLKIRDASYNNLDGGIYKELVAAYQAKVKAPPPEAPPVPIGAPPPKPPAVPGPAKSFPAPPAPPDERPGAALAFVVVVAVLWLMLKK